MKAKLIDIIVRTLDAVETQLLMSRAKRNPNRNIHNVLWERATHTSANLVERHLNTSMVFRNKKEMWDYVISILLEKHKNGTCLEFGVAAGKSINYLSGHLDTFRFYGFDSFEGLKEDWVGHNARKGAYSLGGKLPKVNENVTLVKGWFDQTLPETLPNLDVSCIHFYHIDGDTYDAAEVVLSKVAPLFKKGDLILFDELIGYPNWENGEYRALLESVKKFDFEFRYRAFTTEQALIEIC